MPPRRSSSHPGPRLVEPTFTPPPARAERRPAAAWPAGRIGEAAPRALTALVAAELVLLLALPLLLLPPPEGLSLGVYSFGLATARAMVLEGAAGTVVLVMLALWALARWPLPAVAGVPLLGVALTASPLWVKAGSLATHGPVVYLGAAGLALLLGALFWALALLEPRALG